MTDIVPPAVRPARPFFSSGPCAKRPGWTPEALKGALVGRSHRSKPGKAKLKDAIERTKKLLDLSIASRDDYDKAEATFHALEATVLSDEASVSRAQLQVEFTSIKAPITLITIR